MTDSKECNTINQDIWQASVINNLEKKHGNDTVAGRDRVEQPAVTESESSVEEKCRRNAENQQRLQVTQTEDGPTAVEVEKEVDSEDKDFS
ncbi:hypothetical protein T4B_2046 [Trichinella pseudospiralis]|uniref:Uncharacterized protein n=1 Tax=Trichinella pseudospiralis TaxID=6337 RepID=A0A0V1K2W8_TRIPS|nr:hypothetical protein T4B_2046 [Trichinella pseudospiralis]KRZ41575.1 hypothetical protein T4C_7902 [Trichinella pseudospiralis]